MKVHLVDGTFELFRAFFGAPPAHDSGGRPVGAVRGLLATLVSLLREPGVTHVACAFDHTGWLRALRVFSERFTALLGLPAMQWCRARRSARRRG
jgi:hypothetical protein